MNCEEFKNHLPDFVDGELPEPLSKQLIAHKDSCPACGKMYADHCGIIRVFQNSVISIPQQLHENILARLRSLPSESTAANQIPSSGPSALGLKAILTLAGILAIGVGILTIPSIFTPSIPQSYSPSASKKIQTASPLPKVQTEAENEAESAYSNDTETRIRVAAADSSPSDKKTARYLCSGRNDENQITAAFNLLRSRAGSVELSEGTYVCSGMLIPPPGITLLGHGANKTILKFEKPHPISILINQQGITLRNFSVTGKGSILIRSGNIKLQGIGIQSLSSSHVPAEISPVAAFDVVVSEKPIINVLFENCSVAKTSLAGFAIRSRKSPSDMKNIRVMGCQTMECGMETNRPGYLVSHAQDVTFMNCTDEGSHIGWLINDQSSKINIIDSSARSDKKWALWIHNAHHLSVTGFHQIDQQGAEGTQSMNGLPEKTGTIAFPVTDSIFELFRQGGANLPLINETGLRNQFSLHSEPAK